MQQATQACRRGKTQNQRNQNVFITNTLLQKFKLQKGRARDIKEFISSSFSAALFLVPTCRHDSAACHSHDAPHPIKNRKSQQYFACLKPPSLVEYSRQAPLLTLSMPVEVKPLAPSLVNDAPIPYGPTESIFQRGPSLSPCYK